MSALVDWFNVFVNKFVAFCNIIISVLSYIWSIIKTLWYWLTSLLTGAWELITDFFSWYIFDYLGYWFTFLTNYIWVWPVVFMSSLLLLILLKIWISYVFKIFRLNLDHKVFSKK